MKLVINVPDYIKEQADDGKAEEFGIPRWLAYEIANGTPLPKGHGRLKDVDRLESHDEYDGQGFTKSVYKDDIDDLTTIIEAAKEIIKDEKE